MTTTITTTAALTEFCDRVKSAPFIAVDTEFMRETTYWPKLCLIQAATATDAAVIDPLAETISVKSQALTAISRSIVQDRVSSALPFPAGEAASAVKTELDCEAA